MVILDQISIEAGPERIHELNGVRSQIDYYNFILKLLKEEHKNLSAKSLLIVNKTTEDNNEGDQAKENDAEINTATDFMKLKVQAVNA